MKLRRCAIRRHARAVRGNVDDGISRQQSNATRALAFVITGIHRRRSHPLYASLRMLRCRHNSEGKRRRCQQRHVQKILLTLLHVGEQRSDRLLSDRVMAMPAISENFLGISGGMQADRARLASMRYPRITGLRIAGSSTTTAQVQLASWRATSTGGRDSSAI